VDTSPKTFADLGLHPDLLKGVADMGFTELMPVQAMAIPPILAGRDVIASARTGSGKTAAFMLPILHRILQNKGRRGLFALVLAPTRELALQSTDHLGLLSRHVPARGTAIYGGVGMAPQIEALRRGVDIISATPGRLLDHAGRGRIDFSTVQALVLDEVDRMLDMGFLPDVWRILDLLPAKRQNIVMSATIPSPVRRMLDDICHDPVVVQVGEMDRPPESIRHTVYPVIHEQKAEFLFHVLKKLPKLSSVIVFTRTKDEADRVAEVLTRNGVKVALIHGDRDQSERTRALADLKSGARQVLVATEIVSRGIDIKDLTHVVNYDPPETPEAYIHRVGRTGRVDAEGDAITLMDPMEEPWILSVEKAMGRKIDRVILPDFTYRKSKVDGSYHPRPNYIQSFPRGGRRGGRGGFGRR
jgi:ATP-dependent RNA helicase RhlE